MKAILADISGEFINSIFITIINLIYDRFHDEPLYDYGDSLRLFWIRTAVNFISINSQSILITITNRRVQITTSYRRSKMIAETFLDKRHVFEKIVMIVLW